MSGRGIMAGHTTLTDRLGCLSRKWRGLRRDRVEKKSICRKHELNDKILPLIWVIVARRVRA